MKVLYCLVHTDQDGTRGHLFHKDTHSDSSLPDAGEVAAQLGVDFVLTDERLEVVIVGREGQTIPEVK
jgi:hypothetical protein